MVVVILGGKKYNLDSAWYNLFIMGGQRERYTSSANITQHLIMPGPGSVLSSAGCFQCQLLLASDSLSRAMIACQGGMSDLIVIESRLGFAIGEAVGFTKCLPNEHTKTFIIISRVQPSVDSDDNNSTIVVVVILGEKNQQSRLSLVQSVHYGRTAWQQVVL